MINDFDKKVYENTKAPLELKKRVMDMYDDALPQKKNTVNYKKYLSLAACLVLILGVSAFFSVSKVSVSVDGNAVGLSPASNYSGYSSKAIERSGDSSKAIITIDLESKVDTVISVTGGKVTLIDEETGEKLSEGTSLSFKGKVIAFWDITSQNDDCEMTVKNFISKKTVKAQYDAQEKTHYVNEDLN